MANSFPNTIAVNLPAELVAKMEELKQDREEDRDKSIEEIVVGFCRTYVTVREAGRWELAHMDELNRSYEQQPDDWADAAEWEALYRKSQEEMK